jgi:hypothetical protein
MPFLLAEILNYQGSAHLIGVGSLSILQKIFLDHYEEMLYMLHPRQAVIENVDRMIHCGDPSFYKKKRCYMVALASM